jgi:hypothetical protein
METMEQAKTKRILVKPSRSFQNNSKPLITTTPLNFSLFYFPLRFLTLVIVCKGEWGEMGHGSNGTVGGKIVNIILKL